MRGFSANVDVLTEEWLGRLAPFYHRGEKGSRLQCRIEFRSQSGERDYAAVTLFALPPKGGRPRRELLIFRGAVKFSPYQINDKMVGGFVADFLKWSGINDAKTVRIERDWETL